MSQKTKAELSMIKPLSRFVEHFDLMPPTELLDTSSIEIPDEPLEQQSKKPISPLYALPNGVQRKYPSNLSIKSAEPFQTSGTMYSPTSPTTDIRDYSRNIPLSPTMESSPSTSQIPSDLLKSVKRSQSNPANSSTTNLINDMKKTSDPTVTMTNMASLPSKEAFANTVVVPSKNNNMKISISAVNNDYISPSPGKSKFSRTSLNKADIIIKRYDAWSKFLTLIISWAGEVSRLSLQSERSFSSLLKETRFSNTKGSNIDSANGIHATIHGFTMDLALQEQQFGHRLKEHVPILETFKKECTMHTKGLKSRSDLALDEFLRRAEVTASLMVQLNKTCKEARRTIEKGVQLTNDPWLTNLCKLMMVVRSFDNDLI